PILDCQPLNTLGIGTAIRLAHLLMDDLRMETIVITQLQYPLEVLDQSMGTGKIAFQLENADQRQVSRGYDFCRTGRTYQRQKGFTQLARFSKLVALVQHNHLGRGPVDPRWPVAAIIVAR